MDIRALPWHSWEPREFNAHRSYINTVNVHTQQRVTRSIQCAAWGAGSRPLSRPLRPCAHECLHCSAWRGQEVGGLPQQPGLRFRGSLWLCGALRWVCLLVLPAAESGPEVAACLELGVCGLCFLESLRPLGGTELVQRTMSSFTWGPLFPSSCEPARSLFLHRLSFCSLRGASRLPS